MAIQFNAPPTIDTERPPKPFVVDVDAAGIPDELKERKQWVLWRHELRTAKDGSVRWQKMPKQPDESNAASDDPGSWLPFHTAYAVYQANRNLFDGIGFVFSADDPYTGVDLDACRNPETELLTDWATDITSRLNSYCEVSPSGQGVKLIVRASLRHLVAADKTGKSAHPKGVTTFGEKTPEVALYDERRFWCLTGNRLDFADIEPRQAEVDALFAEYITNAGKTRGKASGTAKTGSKTRKTKLDRLIEQSRDAKNGQRSEHDFDLCTYAIRNRLSKDELWSRVESVGKFAEGGRRYFDTTWENAEREVSKNQSGSSLLSIEGRTEAANATRLVERFGNDVRWCDPWNKWLVWDGKRWKHDDSRRVEALAKSVAADLWDEVAEASKEADDATLKHMWKFVAVSNQANGIRNAVSLSRPDLAVLPATLDTHQWLLNVDNGTLDLRDGTLRPHDRNDYLTQLAPVAYDPAARFTTWRRFLETILAGNRDLIVYVQRLVGLSLTGSTREHLLPFLHGIGANGKSTFIGTLLAMLGQDYAIKAPTDLLLAKQDTHPTERADLYGKRLVACVEAEDGRRLAESLVKELTGGDKVRARRMREDFWEFQATHKIWLAANHKPVVRGTDHGIWRRIKLLPFTVTIPDDQQDKELPAKLLDELPGILAWSVEGCRQWLADGLREPECVRAATGDYRNEMDLVGRFIDECCIIDPKETVGATALFKRYRQWCDDTGERGLNQTRFGGQMTERGYHSDKVGGRVLRFGIRLPEGVE